MDDFEKNDYVANRLEFTKSSKIELSVDLLTLWQSEWVLLRDAFWGDLSCGADITNIEIPDYLTVCSEREHMLG